MAAPGSGANPEVKRAVCRLWDSGDRVMVVRGASGAGKTALPQQGRSALRAGTVGHHALTKSWSPRENAWPTLTARAAR